jgi:hypothetical protein
LDAEHRQRGLPTADELPLIQEDYLNNSLSVLHVLTQICIIVAIYFIVINESHILVYCDRRTSQQEVNPDASLSSSDEDDILALNPFNSPRQQVW